MALAETLSVKGLPANLIAERSVLGAILLDGFNYYQAEEILTPDDFHLESHRKIFKAIRQLAQGGVAADFITLGDALERTHDLDAVGGHAYLITLTDGLPRTVNVEHYARIVQDYALRRTLLGTGNEIVQSCLDGASSSLNILDAAQEALFKASSARVREGLVSVGALAPDIMRKIDELHGQEITGLKTGYADLDSLTAGLQPSDLIIIAGRPSMGKTSFAMNIVENAALLYGKTAAVFSLEMAKVQLVMRMLCSTARVNAHKLRTGFLNRGDIEGLTDAAGRLAEAKIYIDDTAGIDVATLRAKCRRLKQERGLDLVVVDYLQLMSSSGRAENRNVEISGISRGLKTLAKELEVPLIALSQLSRASEQRKGEHRPILSDLRESGSIEQDADVVGFIYRDEVYNRETEDKGKAEIIIAKQRNGPTETVKLAFLRDFTRFENLAEEL